MSSQVSGEKRGLRTAGVLVMLWCAVGGFANRAIWDRYDVWWPTLLWGAVLVALVLNLARVASRITGQPIGAALRHPGRTWDEIAQAPELPGVEVESDSSG